MENIFLRLMGQHLVALIGECERYKDGVFQRRGVYAISGFIMEAHGCWFWVTAGHCLRDLDSEIEKGNIKLLTSHLADYFGIGATHVHGVPHPYEPHCGYYVYEKEQGLDFGFIVIPPLTRMAFEKNKIIPVSRSNWIKQDDLNFEHFKMIGIPAETIKDFESPDGLNGAGFRIALIAVDRCAPQDMPREVADSWFTGYLRGDVPQIDIQGMSGGPIYGFRQGKNGEWYHHVVAIQSGWFDRSRAVYACSFPQFAETMNTYLGGLLDEMIEKEMVRPE